MMGMNETGKTALVSQFLTSEYMNTYDASLGECQNKKATTGLPCWSETRFVDFSLVVPLSARFCFGRCKVGSNGVAVGQDCETSRI